MPAARKQSNSSNTPKTPKTDGEKKARVQKTYAPVSLSDLTPVKLAARDKVTVIPGRERSEEQKAVDAVAKDLAFEYIKAGSPKQFLDMPVVSYTVPTEQAATVRFMIGKACNLLNCKPKFGRQAWDGGKEVVSFCAIPRDPSQWTDEPKAEDAEQDAGGTPDEAPADDAPADKQESNKTDPSEFLEAS